MPVDKMPVDKMPADNMPVDKMPVEFAGVGQNVSEKNWEYEQE